MSARTQEQKAAVVAAVKAEIENNTRPSVESEHDFWNIIRAALQGYPYNMPFSTYQCRSLFKSCRKDKAIRDTLPDVRKYISKGVKRSKRVREAILREQAKLAGSEEKAAAEDSDDDTDVEDVEMEKENGGDDESEEPRAAQMTLAVRPK